jgi:hypothetical protein
MADNFNRLVEEIKERPSYEYKGKSDGLYIDFHIVDGGHEVGRHLGKAVANHGWAITAVSTSIHDGVRMWVDEIQVEEVITREINV